MLGILSAISICFCSSLLKALPKSSSITMQCSHSYMNTLPAIPSPSAPRFKLKCALNHCWTSGSESLACEANVEFDESGMTAKTIGENERQSGRAACGWFWFWVVPPSTACRKRAFFISILSSVFLRTFLTLPAFLLWSLVFVCRCLSVDLPADISHPLEPLVGRRATPGWLLDRESGQDWNDHRRLVQPSSFGE